VTRRTLSHSRWIPRPRRSIQIVEPSLTPPAGSEEDARRRYTCPDRSLIRQVSGTAVSGDRKSKRPPPRTAGVSVLWVPLRCGRARARREGRLSLRQAARGHACSGFAADGYRSRNEPGREAQVLEQLVQRHDMVVDHGLDSRMSSLSRLMFRSNSIAGPREVRLRKTFLVRCIFAKPKVLSQLRTRRCPRTFRGAGVFGA